MDARSSDDALPSAPPEPAGAPSPSQPPSPTRIEKQADVRDLLASFNRRTLDKFRSNLEDAFFALKMPSQDLDKDSQDDINLCQNNIGQFFEAIISDLSELEPGLLPEWLARCIFITPSQNRPDIIPADDPSQNRPDIIPADDPRQNLQDIIPADDLFQVYRTWCTSHEHFDFYSALTDLFNLGLQPATTVSEKVDEKKYATYARSFDSDLHGDVVQRFNDTLFKNEAKFDPNIYYGPIIPIVQSSGTGKSRLVCRTFLLRSCRCAVLRSMIFVLFSLPSSLEQVHEMRKVWPTLSVTLRKETNKPGGGFPIQDVDAVKYFKQQKKGVDCDLVTIAFLAAWFKVAAENIPQDEPLTVGAIFDAKWGHSLVDQEHAFVHNSTRQRMFMVVASDANLLIKDWRKNHSGNNVDSMVKQLLEQPLRQFAQRIASLEAVKQQTKEHGCEKPLVLIAFDECNLLSEFLSGYDLLYLRRCFRHIGTMKCLPVSVWLLLLDTNSTISKLWPTDLDQKSLRERSLLQFLPFYAMGFDVLEKKAKAPRPCDALKLDTLKYYGRPLWHGYDAKMLIDVAYSKLGGLAVAISPEDRTKDELSEALAVSLLSNRICLDLVPLRSDQNGGMVVTTTVERHMRIIVDFDVSGRIATQTPSEPMLAIAAWYWLSDDLSFPRSWPNVINYMRKHLLHSESMDMKGVNGETLVRLLLVLARDFTVEARKVRELPWCNQAPDMPAIPFQSFLSALLGESASKLVLDKLQQLDTEAANVVPGQVLPTKRKHPSADTDVAEEEGQCWVNFTHVTPIVSTAPHITSGFLWDVWKRGAAIQCARGQARIDGILPIYRGSLNDDFNDKREAARRMTYMAWQVKNRDQGTKSTECMHGPLVVRPAKETEEPMFTLLLELGTESAFQRDTISETHPKISVSSFECTNPSCCSRSKLQVVRVRGCEAKVYPCLEHWQAADAFGDMVKQRVSDRPISEERTLFDGTLIHEYDDQLYDEPA
ncbi:hypothetical protein ACQY0O_005180 [Thecaphora frezii]